jgi:hypothetical protein
VDSAIACAGYSSGSFTPLNTIGYGLTGASISTVSPGVFSYYSRVTGVSFATGDVITVTETNSSTNGTPLFLVPDQDQVKLYNPADCTKSAANVTILTGSLVRITFNAPFSGNLILGVKYSTTAVVGAPQPSPATVHYDFVTTAKGTVVDHNTNGLDLAPK